MVDVTGGYGESLREAIAKLSTPHPGRFVVFTEPAWSKTADPGYPKLQADLIEDAHRAGAKGLKVLKTLGLFLRENVTSGKLVRIDDPRFDPMWEAAGALRMPIAIHISDPEAFFLPIDRFNERWEELHAHPDWQFPSPPFPPFLSILGCLAELVAHHPRTAFIGAHVGCYAENLAWVGALLDRCPNFFVDIAARLGELGRQPYTARSFFLQYADRILFGSDMGPDLDAYHVIYRFLETDDEYFNYNAAELPLQGRWHVCGLYLPADVLEKVYFRNAERILLKDK
jgi:predicted TIM-barrel fold metal-dependent hydrolase